MFCPKCNQEQLSNEMQFCKNCGFRLNGVRELLAKDGLADMTIERKQISSISHRDISIGAAGMFVFAFFAAMLTLDVPASLITPIAFLVIAAIIFLTLINVTAFIGNYLLNRENKASSENYLSSKNTNNLSIEDKKQETFLPPAQSHPANVVFSGFTTGELERPPSVTENTTKTLKQNNLQ